jgi:hypothetical protein
MATLPSIQADGDTQERAAQSRNPCVIGSITTARLECRWQIEPNGDAPIGAPRPKTEANGEAQPFIRRCVARRSLDDLTFAFL